MRVLITAVGSHGDVAPMTGLGAALRRAGHDVSVATYGKFEDLVTGCGLEFRRVPGDPERVGFSEQGPAWEESGGPLSVLRFMRLVAGHLRELNAAVLDAARRDADVLLVAGMAEPGGYRIAEGLGLPSIGLGLQPRHPTGDFPPPVMPPWSLGRRGNQALGHAVITGGTAAMNKSSKSLWEREGLPGHGAREMYRRQDAARWPFFYGFSPAVVPKPPDWRPGIEVAGYWWPAVSPDWKPPAALEKFLADGPAPVFVGFGSRNPADAGRLTRIVAEARRAAGVRMVVQSGWASLGAGLDGDGDILVIGEAPHEWLFPKMAAVVHHAGAGTAGAGLRAGVPTVSIPLISDQPFWAGRVAALGAGPKPVPYTKLRAGTLAAAIKDAVTSDSYRRRARDISRRLAAEDGTAPVLRALEQLR